MRRRSAFVAASLLAVGLVAGCGDDEPPTDPDPLIADVRAALEAVEAAIGGPQEFFEVTATPRLTNVFVAIDGATAAIPYVYLDGAVQAPGPRIDGATGQTFTAASLDFDEARVLSDVRADLPSGTIDAFSVEGAPGGSARYVVSVRSEQGGVLDVVVAPGGAIIEVNPL